MTDKPEERKAQEDAPLMKRDISRRDFLKYAGATGAAIGLSTGLGSLVAACAKEETTTTGAGTGTSVSAGVEPPAQDKIVIGAARPVSGVYAVFEQAHFGPAYKIWADTVNKAGGINVAGKMLPVEMKVYNDESNLDQTLRLLTKLMEEDKVDFVFPPCSTAYLFAAAGLINDHKYISMSGEGGASTLETRMRAGELPYHFQFLNYSNHAQMPAMRAIAQELGIKTVSIGYLDDLHGIEYNAQAQLEFAQYGLEILSSTAIPLGIKDVSSVVAQWAQEGADLICSFQYPDENILTIFTLMGANYNPKAFLGGPGCSTQAIFDIWKAEGAPYSAADQIMFEGAWSYEQSPEVKAFYDELSAFVGGPANVDFWGALIYKAQLQFFQQAIEEAATLNQDAIAEVMRKAHYKTLMSDDTFMTSDQILDVSCYSGQIGQWQSGVPQVIDVGPQRTAAPIYPKQAWPQG
jgi:branched-chain amino acid transport system substrate-binding protein